MSNKRLTEILEQSVNIHNIYKFSILFDFQFKTLSAAKAREA